ncbi:MAG: ABC transporter permease subunit [Planctomycetes bacterium]|nr:ABC transporter permease subunit [Planctomycetota bacterium]
MNAYLTVIRHELAQAWASPRSRFLFLTSALLILLAVTQGALLYRRQAAEHLRLERLAQEEWVAQESKRPHVAHHFGRWVVKPPSPLSMFDRGVEDFLGQQIVLDAHSRAQPVASNAEADPLSAWFGAFDLGFVIAFLLPLLVIFLAYDALCGEKERGTLRLVLAHPLSRRTFLLGKWSAHALLVLVAFGVPLTAGILVAPPLLGVALRPADLPRLLALLGAALAYLLFFLFLSLWASALTHRPATALTGLFASWVVLLFFIPKAAVLIAQAVHPAPDPVLLGREQAGIHQAREAWRAVRFGELIRDLRKTHPEVPEDFARSRMSRSERAPSDWGIDPTGVFATEANAFLNARRQEAIGKVRGEYERQEQLAARLALLSPATAFLNASMALTGTDPARHRHFLKQVDDYFDRLGTFFNALWAQNVQAFADWESVPGFRYEEEPAAGVWRRFLAGTALLAAFGLVAAGGSIRQMERYDVR